jgi:hypothetical protein
MSDDIEKKDLSHKEVVHDHDVLGGTQVTREDAVHWGQLTEEELVHEKQLKKKIDVMIMPLVMMVRNRHYILWNNSLLKQTQYRCI